MLPAQHRLTRSADFGLCVRRGRRGGSRTIVAHAARPETGSSHGPAGPADPAKVGLVVSKAVGGAVVRNRVARRLRHLAAQRIGELPAGSLIVLRAQPAAAAADSIELKADLDHALDSALAKVMRVDG